MEIITIESSDEESPCSGTSRLITPRQFEIMSSDDDDGSSNDDDGDDRSDSSSSHDSIWVKGISRAAAGQAPVRQYGSYAFCFDSARNFNGSNAVGAARDVTDKPANTCNQCEPFPVDIANRSETKNRNVDDDDSSLSSNDSIWDKVGLWEIGDKSENHQESADVGRCADVNLKCNKNEFDDSSVLPPVSAVQKTRHHDERLESTLPSATENSIVRGTQQHLDSILNQPIANEACSDDSSVSSLESLLQKNYFERKKPLQPNNSASVRPVLEKKVEPANATKKAQQSCDDSSTSSSDSILQKDYFERKKHPIHSYYDYCKYYPSSSKHSTTKAGNESNHNNCNSNTIGAEPTTNKRLPEFIQPPNTEWQITLLMDHREFGCSNNFLQQVEIEINKHFGRKQCEITTLPSADYLYVARLLSTSPHNTGEILQERVLDMVIERKAVQDVCQCLITDSKKYKPLSFFEAQMYKLMNCGVENKVFVMEGDENGVQFGRGMMHGARSQSERERRLKRVKTLRLQLANGEFKGVELVCTKSGHDTVKFLIHQLKVFQESFDPKHPPLRTRDSLTKYIDRQMKSPTFMEYLRLRSIPSIGDVKAMKVIMDPNLDWDKNFLSPASSKTSKSTLEDKATFWKAPESIQINTYIKAKSNKNSSRRKNVHKSEV